MLKAYKVTTYITINNKDKYELFHSSIGLADDFEPHVATHTYNFQECIEYLNANSERDISTDKTLFLERPYVWFKDEFLNPHQYYRFDVITIEKHYTSYQISMDELFQVFSADQCIQYLKERGITTCPILK